MADGFYGRALRTAVRGLEQPDKQRVADAHEHPQADGEDTAGAGGLARPGAVAVILAWRIQTLKHNAEALASAHYFKEIVGTVSDAVPLI